MVVFPTAHACAGVDRLLTLCCVVLSCLVIPRRPLLSFKRSEPYQLFNVTALPDGYLRADDQNTVSCPSLTRMRDTWR
jgi:hypothetical protein